MRRLLLVLVVALALTAPAAASTEFEDAWTRAAAKLDMPVFAAPAAPLGFTRYYVKPEKISGCGRTTEQLTAMYGQQARRVFFVEARPEVCGNLGPAALLARPVVRGVTASLYNLGPGALLVLFTRLRVVIGIQTNGLTRTQLLTIARSVRLVPG